VTGDYLHVGDARYSGGQDEFLFPQAEHHSPFNSGHSHPAYQGKNDHYSEIDPRARPAGREDRREGKPEGDSREGSQQFDEPLDQNVHQSSVIAGQRPDDGAYEDAYERSDQSDGHRDFPADQDTRKEVASEPVGAEEQHHRLIGGFLDPEEVDVGLEDAPEFVLLSPDEELYGYDLAFVFGEFEPVCYRVSDLHHRMDEGAVPFAVFVEEPYLRWRSVNEVFVGCDVVVRRDEIG